MMFTMEYVITKGYLEEKQANSRRCKKLLSEMSKSN